MAHHTARISWERKGSDFLKGRYSREHTWAFDGGVVVAASSSPSHVPLPFSNPANVDPEEAYVAAISSCHMLSFLFVAYRAGFQVDGYQDEAVGMMADNEKGVPWVASVALHPVIVYGGERVPSAAEAEELHHLAHEQCFIANSIRISVTTG